MKEFTVKLEGYDGDIYKYEAVSGIEIKDEKLKLKYGADENVTHLLDYVEELLIKRNH